MMSHGRRSSFTFLCLGRSDVRVARMMKLPFPYRIAAELVLFQGHRKFTLYHLIPVILASVTVCVLIHRLTGPSRWFIAIATFLVVAVGTFWMFRTWLPLLMAAVKWGFIEQPVEERLQALIRSYAGRRDEKEAGHISPEQVPGRKGSME